MKASAAGSQSQKGTVAPATSDAAALPKSARPAVASAGGHSGSTLQRPQKADRPLPARAVSADRMPRPASVTTGAAPAGCATDTTTARPVAARTPSASVAGGAGATIQPLPAAGRPPVARADTADRRPQPSSGATSAALAGAKHTGRKPLSSAARLSAASMGADAGATRQTLPAAARPPSAKVVSEDRPSRPASSGSTGTAKALPEVVRPPAVSAGGDAWATMQPPPAALRARSTSAGNNAGSLSQPSRGATGAAPTAVKPIGRQPQQASRKGGALDATSPGGTESAAREWPRSAATGPWGALNPGKVRILWRPKTPQPLSEEVTNPIKPTRPTLNANASTRWLSPELTRRAVDAASEASEWCNRIWSTVCGSAGCKPSTTQPPPSLPPRGRDSFGSAAPTDLATALRDGPGPSIVKHSRARHASVAPLVTDTISPATPTSPRKSWLPGKGGGLAEEAGFRARREASPAYLFSMEQLALQGFAPLETGGGGDCFFRALSFLLTDTEEHHLTVRKILSDHFDLSKPFLLEIGHPAWSLDDIARRLRKPGEDGTGEASTMAAEVFERPVKVWGVDANPHEPDFTTAPTRWDRAGKSAETNPPLRLAFYESPDFKDRLRAAQLLAAGMEEGSPAKLAATEAISNMGGGHYDALRPLRANERHGMRQAAVQARAEAIRSRRAMLTEAQLLDISPGLKPDRWDGVGTGRRHGMEEPSVAGLRAILTAHLAEEQLEMAPIRSQTPNIWQAVADQIFICDEEASVEQVQELQTAVIQLTSQCRDWQLAGSPERLITLHAVTLLLQRPALIFEVVNGALDTSHTAYDSMLQTDTDALLLAWTIDTISAVHSSSIAPDSSRNTPPKLSLDAFRALARDRLADDGVNLNGTDSQGAVPDVQCCGASGGGSSAAEAARPAVAPPAVAARHAAVSMARVSARAVERSLLTARRAREAASGARTGRGPPLLPIPEGPPSSAERGIANRNMMDRVGPPALPQHSGGGTAAGRWQRTVTVPGHIQLEDWLEDPDGNPSNKASLLCVFTGSRQEEGSHLLAGMEALGWSGTVRIQKRPYPMVIPARGPLGAAANAAEIGELLAFKMFTFDGTLRASMWGQNGTKQPWRDIGGIRVYTHLDAAPPGEAAQRQRWGAGLSITGFICNIGRIQPLSTRDKLKLTHQALITAPLEQARADAAQALMALQIPPWTCLKGIHTYVQDNAVMAVVVIRTDDEHRLITAPAWSKLGGDLQAVSRIVYDRWGLFWGPKLATTTPPTISGTAGGHGGRPTQHGTAPGAPGGRGTAPAQPPAARSDLEAPTEVDPNTRLQDRMDALALAFEERMAIIQQSTAASAESARAALALETDAKFRALETAQRESVTAAEAAREAQSLAHSALQGRLNAIELAQVETSQVIASNQQSIMTFLLAQEERANKRRRIRDDGTALCPLSPAAAPARIEVSQSNADMAAAAHVATVG